MKKIIMAAGLIALLAAVPAIAQMMTPGLHMMQQQAPPQQQHNPYMMYPGMMGGYGYGMGPYVMGGCGTPHPMHHGMMGGYGWGMGHT